MCEIVRKTSESQLVTNDMLTNSHKRSKCSLHIVFMHPAAMLNQVIEVYGYIFCSDIFRIHYSLQV